MLIKSYGSVKVFEPEPEKVEQALADFVQALARRDQVVAVWLIGSYHRKDFGPFSDLDLVIIISASNQKFLDRSAEYLPSQFPVPVDLFVYTLDEVTAMRGSGHHFWSGIEKDHTVLFQRGGVEF
jgi:predicted nucleotidyltransferase